jgi:hypothetical protein
MLLIGEYDSRGGRYARFARLYLRRCSAYGHPERALYAASVTPGPIRRAVVTIIEGIRKDGIGALVRRALNAILIRTRLKTSAATRVVG